MRRSARNLSDSGWNEQIIQGVPPISSSGIQDPTIRLLVPRSGFLALDIDGGLSLDVDDEEDFRVLNARFDDWSVK